jgi:hypothetical protein
VLFGASALFRRTATQTALEGSIILSRAPGFQLVVAEHEWTTFGATVSGNVSIPWFCPYPVLLPPGTFIQAVAGVLGTDATVDLTVRAEFGLLG